MMTCNQRRRSKWNVKETQITEKKVRESEFEALVVEVGNIT